MSSPCLSEKEFLDYLEGTLDPASRARSEAHLDECDECRAVVAGVARLHETESTAADAAITTGDRLGRYVILAWLGAGGMGAVYTAFDPALDRKVALKIWNPRNEDGDQESLLRQEAKLAARISSPRVVAIYDVGVAEGRVFVAMELVKGTTLEAWSRAQKRDWQATLSVVMDAGAGLAAAHASMVAHGDFKPDNVLIDSDDRAKVTDFGLGSLHHSDARTGGTPRYMAPEQVASGTPSELADQWSFAVTAWQILYGSHPYLADGETGPVDSPSPLRPPAKRTAVPEYVQRALTRALAFDPTARFPTMETLLLALAPSARGRRLSIALGVGIALIGVVFLGARPFGRHEVPPCAGMETHLAGVWDAPRKSAVHEAFRATGLTIAEQAWQSTERALDRYTERWLNVRSEICVATRVRREQSEILMDARMACLDERLRDVRAQVDVLARTDTKILERAASAVTTLQRPDTCSEVSSDGDTPFRDKKTQADLATVRNSLADARALRSFSRLNEALAPARVAIDGAREHRFAREEAEGLYLLGSSQIWSTPEVGAETLLGAYERAENAKADRVRAEILIDLIYAYLEKTRIMDAKTLLPVARAAIQRLGNPPELLARYESVFAGIYANEGFSRQELSHLETAIHILREIMAEDDFPVLTMRANASSAKSRLGRAREQVADLEDIRRRVFLKYGKHPAVIRMAGNLAHGYFRLRRYDEALREIDEAHSLYSAGGPLQLSQGTLHQTKARVLLALHRLSEARREVELAGEVFTSVVGANHWRAAEIDIQLASIDRAEGKAARAIENDRKAVAIYEHGEKLNSPEYAGALVDLAESLELSGQRREALSLVERAIPIYQSHEGDPEDLAYAQFAAARLLLPSRDKSVKARACSLATLARTFYEAEDYLASSRDRVAAWTVSSRCP